MSEKEQNAKESIQSIRNFSEVLRRSMPTAKEAAENLRVLQRAAKAYKEKSVSHWLNQGTNRPTK